jgi:hypothetical protein
MYCPPAAQYLLWPVVNLLPLDERVRRLCAKLITAKDHELEEVVVELRSALQEHSNFVRRIASRTLIKLRDKPPSSDEAA